MPGLYVPLDVNYAEDHKIIEVGPMAELLYVRGLAFVKRARTNGYIHAGQMPVIAVRLPRARVLIGRLVECGLWEIDGDGYYISAWAKRNPPVDELSDNGVAGAHKRWHLKRNQPNPNCPICVAEGLTDPP
jgi:hypothetical protein